VIFPNHSCYSQKLTLKWVEILSSNLKSVIYSENLVSLIWIVDIPTAYGGRGRRKKFARLFCIPDLSSRILECMERILYCSPVYQDGTRSVCPRRNMICPRRDKLGRFMILQNFVDFMPADNIFHDIQLKPP
jgi:hypothetical protein